MIAHLFKWIIGFGQIFDGVVELISFGLISLAKVYTKQRELAKKKKRAQALWNI